MLISQVMLQVGDKASLPPSSSPAQTVSSRGAGAAGSSAESSSSARSTLQPRVLFVEPKTEIVSLTSRRQQLEALMARCAAEESGCG